MEVEGRFTIHDVCSPCSLAIQQQVQNEDLCIDVEGYMWYDLALHDHNQNDAVGRQSASVQLLTIQQAGMIFGGRVRTKKIVESPQKHADKLNSIAFL